MFCENCGKPIEPGSTFCATCGTRVNEDPQDQDQNQTPEEAPVEANAEAPVEAPVEPQVETPVEEPVEEVAEVPVEEPSEPIAEAPAEEMPAFCANCGAQIETGCTFCAACGTPVGEGTAPVAKKSVFAAVKKVITKKLIIIVVAAAVGIGAISWAYPYGANFFMKTFATPGQYFGFVVGNNIDDTASVVGEAWDIYRDMFVDGITVKETVKYETGEGLGTMLEDISGGEFDASVIDWVQDATIEGKAQAKGGQLKADVDLKINGTKLGNFSFACDFEAGEFYFGAPDYNKQYLQISGGGTASSEALPAVLAALPDGDQIEKIVKRYAKVVTKNVKNVNRSSSTITANGVSQKVTKLEVTIDGDTVKDVGIAVLEELRDDKDIKKIVEDVADAVDEDAPEMEDGIDDAIDALEDADFGDEEIYFDLYVNAKGEVVGFEMEFDSSEFKGISVLMAESGGKFGVEAGISLYSYGVGDMEFGYEGGGSQTLGKRTGTITYVIKKGSATIDLINVDLKGVDVSKAKNGIFDGKMTISFAEGITDLFGESGMDVPEEIFNISIVVDANSSSMKDYKGEAAIMYGNEVCFKVTDKVKVSGSGKVKMPTDYLDATDQDDFEEWLDGFNKDKFIEKLEKIGLPDEAMDAVEEGLDY